MFRPLVVAIEIDFQPPTEAALIDLWDRLRAAGHPTPGGPGPPHVSLAAGLGLATPSHVADLEAAVRASLNSAPSALVLDHVGVFPGQEQVVYLAPAVTNELLDWHGALWPAAQRALADPIAYYAPRNWTPHCTMRWGPGRPVEEAIAWLREHAGLPITAPLGGVALRVYEKGRLRQPWRVSFDA
jgi:2'-5' RNA ligase